jgi:hypothetical protein
MLNKLIISFLIIIFSLPGFCASSIIYSKGNVQIIRNNQTIKANRKTKVLKNDIIITEKNSVAIINLENYAKLKVMENTKITIEELKKKAGKKEKTSVFINAGSLFNKVIKKTIVNKKRSFTVKTKHVAMGVRGTQFFVAYNPVRKKDLWMCVNEGKVNVENFTDKKNVLVKEGEGIFINQGKDITSPRAYEWTKNINWNMNPKSGSLKNNINLESAYADLLDQDYD